jgi:hypothetical protein
MWRTVRALPVSVNGRLNNRQRSKLRIARELSPRLTKVAQTPVRSLL